MAAAPWSPIAGTRAPLLPKKRKRTSTKAAPTTPPPYDPYAGAKESVEQIINTMLASIDREKQLAYEQAQREAETEYQRGQALAQGLRDLGISDAVQKAYQNAAGSISGLASGFSGQLRDQASSDAARYTGMLSGTGQEGSVRNQGENMGNVTYGRGGAIPASAFLESGAAFAANAALQPGFALQFGAQNEAARRAQWADEELPGWTNKRLDILDKKPDLLLDFIKQTSKAAGAPKITYRNLADGRIGVFQNGKLIRKEGPARAKKGTADKPVKLEARTVNGQVYWFNPYTGEQVGKKYGKADAKGGSSKGSKSKPWIQILPNGDGTYTRYDMRSGKKLGVVGTPYKTDAPAKRPDGMTPSALRRARADAFSTVKGWKANGMADDDGNPYRAQDLLKYMTQDKQIPFDIAVRTLAKFYKPARKWYTNKKTPTATSGGGITIPASFKSTHPTDNLDGFPAIDIMGEPGTPVKAPEDGVVERHGSAQGGQAMYFRGRSGKLYWLGHIDNMAPVGSRIRRGQAIAAISADHPRPHVHIGINSSGARV